MVRIFEARVRIFVGGGLFDFSVSLNQIYLNLD